jgi:hypothetical protein
VSNDLHRDCIDAERFAAWVDGGLTPEEAALVETHLADCARCQAMMAAFAKTDDAARGVAPARVLPFSRRGVVRWGLPLAAAASVAIWVAVSRNPELPPAVQSARVEPPPQLEPAPAPVAAPPAPEARPAQPQSSRPSRVASARPEQAAPKSAEAPRAIDSIAEVSAREQALAMPPPPPAPPLAPPPAPASASAPQRMTMSTALPPDLSPEAQVIRAEFASPVPEPQAFTSRAAGRGGGGRGGAAPAASAAQSSSAPPVVAPLRWRIFANGRVERSETNGSTWQTAPVDPALMVFAGGAPSRLVCWLIGRNGVVLLTTNAGGTFVRTDVPGGPDLSAIRVTDERQASVTTTDGRTFTTTDAGMTWRSATP